MCRDEPSAVAVPLLCRCCAVNETPSLVPQNRLHSFGPRSPIAHRLLQTGSECLHPRPWFPAFGGMTTSNEPGFPMVPGLRRDDDFQRAGRFLEATDFRRARDFLGGRLPTWPGFPRKDAFQPTRDFLGRRLPTSPAFPRKTASNVPGFPGKVGFERTPAFLGA